MATQAAAEHLSNCDDCRGCFAGLSEAQLELMRPMVEVARERGIDKLIVCPTPYWSFWKNCYQGKVLGEEYYPAWRDSDLMDGVQVYHCTVRGEKVREVQQAGLRNYIYWYNGAYEYYRCTPANKRIGGLWGGFAELSHGWYLYRWSDDEGVVPLDDCYDTLRELPSLTQHAWLCGGGDFSWALWGSYTWDADRFDPAKAEALLVDTLFGEGAAEDYARWKQAVRRNLPHLLGVPRAVQPDQRAAVVSTFLSDAREAGDAASAFASSPGEGIMPRDDCAKRMIASAGTLDERARLAESDTCKVTIGSVTQRQAGEATYRDRDLELSTFWLRFSPRYSQTEEPDGLLHRSQWHMGSGLGMKGPSHRNWFDAGFIDVLIDGKSLDSTTPTFEAVRGQSGEDLLATWDTEQGKAIMRLSLFEGGLRVDADIQDAGEAEIAVQLIAIPGAGVGDWQDMDKAVVTLSGETAHGQPVKLAPGEDWLFWMDRYYDVPRESAEGPCAAVFAAPVPQVECDNAYYVVKTLATYPPGTKQFSLAIWDLHGQKNAESLQRFKAQLPRIRQGFNR